MKPTQIYQKVDDSLTLSLLPRGVSGREDRRQHAPNGWLAPSVRLTAIHALVNADPVERRPGIDRGDARAVPEDRGGGARRMAGRLSNMTPDDPDWQSAYVPRQIAKAR